ALVFPDGALSGWLHGLLRAMLGDASYLAPLLVVGLGLAAARPSRVPAHRLGRRAVVSWAAILAAAAALLQPLGGQGGLLGWSLYSLLVSLLGPASTALVLCAWLAAALGIATGVGPIDLAITARRIGRWAVDLIPRRPDAPVMTISGKNVPRTSFSVPLPRLRPT